MFPSFSYSLCEQQKFAKIKPPLIKNNQELKRLNERNQKKIKKSAKEEKREECLIEQIGYFRNNVVEKDPKALKKMALQQDELEGFLTGLEFNELKKHYNDFNFADMVLQFPNPDQNPIEKICQNRPITFDFAEKTFDDMLTVMGNDGFSKAQLKNEREAFLYSFLLLADYEDEKDQNKTQRHRVRKDKNQQLSDYDAYLKQIEEIKRQQEEDQKDDIALNTQGGAESNQDNLQNLGDNLLHNLINIKLGEVNQFSKVKKAYSLGGFLKKNVITSDNYDWVCNNNSKPRDFVTLVRNTIQTKLTRNANLHSRLFIDPAGSSIFMAIKSNENVIKNEAEVSGLNKQLELGYADLFSLEPVDKLYRPLRLKKFIRKQVSDFALIKENSEIKKNIIKELGQTYDLNEIEKNAQEVYLTILKTEQKFNNLQNAIKKKAAKIKSETVKKMQSEFTKKRTSLNEDKELANEEEQQNEQQNVAKNKNKSLMNSLKDILNPHAELENVEQEEKQFYTSFWNKMAYLQTEVDEWMESLAQDLKIDTTSEKTEIIQDDDSTTQDEWRVYYIYLFYLCQLSRYVKKLILLGKGDLIDRAKRGGESNIIEMNKGFLYKLIFRKALGDANENHKNNFGFLAQKQILKSLWNRLGMEDPISPYTDYFQTNQKESEGETIWRQYEINEKGHRSIFLNMEKLKLANSIILKQINMSRLIKFGLITAYFPIHDCYQLKGILKEQLFGPLKTNQLMYDEKETTSEKALREIFEVLKDEAESTDFDSESVQLETVFNPIIPWQINVSSIRDYFGEKIAIYFQFLSFYAFHLSYISVIAIFVQIVQSNGHQDSVDSVNILFAIMIIVWSTMFIELWKREQVVFSLRYGQQGFEEDEAERPSFDGVYIRNITNDDLNEEYYSPQKRKMKMLFSIFISFVIISIVVSFVFMIFELKLYLLEHNFKELQNPVLNANTIPSILNSIQIIIFNIIYDKLGDILNNFENHKILSSYENSLIAKIFLFQFFNLFNSSVFVAYLSPLFTELHLCQYAPGKEDCFVQLSSQIMIIFLVNFAKNIQEIMQPLIILLIKKKSSGTGVSAKKNEPQHPFKEIDDYIQEQSLLDPYMTNEEVDGTVADYMELIVQFSFLTIFGLSFPTSFVLAFLNNIVEIQVDKTKLMMFSRRPMPSGAANIGTWLVILDVITFCGIFSNAGLIAYTSNPIIIGNFRLINMGDDYVEGEQDERIITFCSLLLVFLAVKYFFRFIVPDTPQIATTLNKRHKVAVDTVVRGFQKSKNKQYKTAKFNFNVGGIVGGNMTSQQNLVSEPELNLKVNLQKKKEKKIQEK